MGDAAIEPSSVNVPALHAGDYLGQITKGIKKSQKDTASSISSTASAASDGTKTGQEEAAGQEEAVAGRGEDTSDIPFKAVPLGLPRSTSSVTQPDSPALRGAKTLVAVDAETPLRRQLLQELLPRPTATATDRDGRVGEEEVDGLLSSPAGVADGGGGTADAGAVVSDSETAAADATPVDAILMPPRHLSISWSEISLHLDDEDEGGRKEATTAKDGESNSPVRTLSSATPSLWDVRGKSSSSKAFGSNRSATTNLEVSDLFEKIRNATNGGYASGSGLFGGRGKAAAVSDVSLSSDDEIASEKESSTREYFEAMGSRPARRLPGLAPFRSGIVSGNGKNGGGADNDGGFPAAEELDPDMDRGGFAGALWRRGILEQSPLMPPPHPPPFRQSPEASSATVSPMVSAAARARLEAEVDVEEGFVWATSPPAATAVVARAADTGAEQVVAGADDLGVAIWGKDFKPEVHAEVLKASEEKGYRPSVDVFLPMCKEPLRLLANTWKYVAALDYPDFKVFVLDDGASEGAQALASTFGFEYVLRADVPALKKAGNLRNAFARTSGEAIAIFDADFCPRADFLKETVPYLGEDPTIGIVQTPQFFRHRKEQTWVEQGAGVTQEFFYRMVQMNQDRFNAAVCVGSCGLYRRAALEPLGGMAAIEHSEDM
ncbi:Cellulose synthase (UDP-forming), family GT2 [Ectocarpus siliculosus]|uniref:Cellulose synthase (UDP-forming), family GT2 n=1 Tax=Ectocarpus siliculosus TaxID=2880 RepID=D7G9A1_ECTSI|nr:Cellulose synthase (UDP-forming), family GT2 [Ectocarpus siliculosus]|eukprot:CBJ28244.1 Cellulose synthase (UDP-forming), family GT2 [Ectocarpus siliculosus]